MINESFSNCTAYGTDINQPQAKFGPTGDKFYDCHVGATPLVGESIAEHFNVVLKLTVINRERDTPIMVLLPRNHAIRLVKDVPCRITGCTQI